MAFLHDPKPAATSPLQRIAMVSRHAHHRVLGDVMGSVLGHGSLMRIAPDRIIARITAGVVMPLLLAGCSVGAYPSMARWNMPVVTASVAQPAAGPAAPVACDTTQADSIDAEFRAALPAARNAVEARGNAAPGSPKWNAADAAIAALEVLRTRLAGQVNAPAQAYANATIDHALAPDAAGKTAAPQACLAHVTALTAQEDDALAKLRTAIAP